MTKRKDKPSNKPSSDETIEPQVEATEEAETTADVPETFFRKRLEHDVWEAWTWTGVGLFGAAVVVWIVAFLKLGMPSVKAYGVGIPLTSMMAVPIMLWGLMKSLLNPPLFRPSRTIAFVLVSVVAFFANKPLMPAPVSTEGWQSKATFTLPFEGTWYTLSGGDSMDHNYLATSPSMRWGYAFTVLKDGRRAPENAAKIDEYYCYGKPILAPVDGEVVEVESRVEDNKPGEPNPYNGMLGNHLIMRVGQGDEHLFVSYLKRGSIPLKVGQKVKRGEVIGACGSSGASAYPHVQLHLQRGDSKLLAEGLPMRFSDYRVGKETYTTGMPQGAGPEQKLTTGQLVTPLARAAQATASR